MHICELSYYQSIPLNAKSFSSLLSCLQGDQNLAFFLTFVLLYFFSILNVKFECNWTSSSSAVCLLRIIYLLFTGGYVSLTAPSFIILFLSSVVLSSGNYRTLPLLVGISLTMGLTWFTWLTSSLECMKVSCTLS